MLLRGAIICVAVINLLALGVSGWASYGIRGAMERYAVEFAGDTAEMSVLEPVRQIVLPLCQVLGCVGALNLFVMVWFYLGGRKGRSLPSKVPSAQVGSPLP